MHDHAITRLLDFDAQVRRDQEQDPAFLHRRDRRFALDQQAQGAPTDAPAWLESIHRFQTPATHPELRRWHTANAGFALAGAVSGIVAMVGLLIYDGTQRINLTLILALILLQGLLALITTLQGLLGWQPWRWLQHRLMAERTPGPLQQLAPQLMARAAQMGGLCFTLAALATLILMVVLQDLAFGWSTTLDTGAPAFHRLTASLASPWQALLPAATPSLELVEATRFYRTDPITPATEPARWGQWWPFVAMTWLTYATLPRLLMVQLAQAHLQSRARRLLERHSGMTALQYRLETPWLDTGNAHNDAGDQPESCPASALQPLPADAVVIQWAGAAEPGTVTAPSPAETPTLQAGGLASLSEDRRTIDLAHQTLRSKRSPAVLIATRGWDPPTGELSDFLSEALRLWPASTSITLVPLSPEPGTPLARQQLEPWLRFAQRFDERRVAVGGSTDYSQERSS